MKINSLDLSFLVIAVISLLNLNGAVAMAIGVEQAGSPLLLVALFVLIWKLGASPIPASGRMLFLALISYLVLASTFSIIYGPHDAAGRLFGAYCITMTMLWAQIIYMGYAARTGRKERILTTVRNLSVVASISVLTSPLLYSFFLNVPPSSEYRFGGFFANPNEAGVMACVGLAFLLAVPLKRMWMHIAALIVCSVAVILTFSKTAWLVMILVWALHLLRKAERNPIFLIIIIATMVSMALIEVREVLAWIMDNPYFQVSFEQQRRIEQVMLADIAGVSAENTLTGRDFLWQFGFAKIMETPLLGHGLGTFHHLEGGLLELDVWQGVHNVYLMFWGEAGPIPFLMLVAASIIVARDVAVRASHSLALPLAMIIFINLQVNHNILSSRYFLVVIAVLITLTVRERQGQYRQEVPICRTGRPS